MTDVKSIHGHTELAEVPATADEVLVWDASAAAHRRVSRANYLGYTEYVALLTQSGTDAPTATVIKNETGATVTFARVNVGLYAATFDSAVLTLNKTACIIIHGASEFLTCSRSAATSVAIASYNTAWALTDGLMSGILIIIRIYD